jgi:hypothetical protein
MLKGKDPYIFVRFGGLNLKKQKAFKKDDSKYSYHSPPAKRGFYAMPKIAQEFFLLGALDKTQPGVFPKSNDGTLHWRTKLRQIRKEFRKTNGVIWHHLEEYVSEADVIQKHGTWVKTSIKVWVAAFSKMSTRYRYGRDKDLLESGINKPGIGMSITGWYSRDHCEVFFDSKI